MNRALVALLQGLAVFDAVPEEVLDEIEGRLEEIRLVPDGVLFRQGAEADGLYFVVEGQLNVFIALDDEERYVGVVEPGEVVGEVQALTGGQRTATIRADGPAVLVEMNSSVLRELLDAVPRLADEFAALIRRRLRRNQLAALLPNLIGPVDEEKLQWVEKQGEWIHVPRGEQLLAQGDPSDVIYLVVSGRLQAVDEEDGFQRVLGEVTRGEPIGEVGMLTGEPRMASIYALRDSELLAFTKPVFDQLARLHPDVLMAITRLAVKRSRSALKAPSLSRHIRCITLVPSRASVPVEALAERLRGELGEATLVLTPERLESRYGTPGAAQFERKDPAFIRLAAWLDEQEDTFDHVLYVTGPDASTWSRQAIQRGDHVFVCGWAHEDPRPGSAERLLTDEDPNIGIRRSLVLLHRDGSRAPTGTARWLDARTVHRHYHVRWNRREDIARVGRFLTDRAIGLTLGGGGARGLAHIGVVQAFRELGIPIDFIGGTSMGACIGAQAALEYDELTMRRLTKQTFIDPKPFKQYTLPLYSVLRNGVFDESAARAYGAGDIEDCWISCFCVASNLSTAETLVLERGPLAEAVLSSMALPGTVAPRIRDGHLIADGGVLNNLPVDVMRERAHRVVAVDVGGGKEGLRVQFEEFPSPWEVVWRYISPFRRPVHVPTLMPLMMRSALLGSIRREQEVEAQSDVYLCPPVNGFALLQMERLDEIIQAGYGYTLNTLAKVRDQLA